MRQQALPERVSVIGFNPPEYFSYTRLLKSQENFSQD
jgi:hypothetical protein